VHKYKAIFFDFDGVLVLSENLHYAAWKKALEKMHLSAADFHLRDVVGLSDFHIAQRLSITHRLAQHGRELIALKTQFYLEGIDSQIGVPQGRDSFLKQHAKEYLMAIVTSSRSDEVWQILQKQEISHYFAFVIGVEMIQFPKPSAEPYFLALKKAEMESSEGLVIEDSEVGVIAAQGAGMDVIHFPSYPSAFHIDEKWTCRSFREIERLLSGQT